MNGLYIAGDVTVQSLDYGDYLLQITDGTMLKVNYQAINKNASLVIKGCIFNKAVGVTAGYNVYREGTANSAWIFTEHSGNYAGESYDYDPDADCGQIRWDDSVCYLHEQVSYRWRADNGIEILGNWTKKKAIPIINSSSNNLITKSKSKWVILRQVLSMSIAEEIVKQILTTFALSVLTKNRF
jgi:hypothetical protein